VFNQHKLVVNEAHILKDNKGTENLTAEEVDRSRLLHQFTRGIKDKGSLVNDNRIDALAGMVHLSDRMGGEDHFETRVDKGVCHSADIGRVAAISRTALRLG
jgi:hypothetical protein